MPNEKRNDKESGKTEARKIDKVCSHSSCVECQSFVVDNTTNAPPSVRPPPDPRRVFFFVFFILFSDVTSAATRLSLVSALLLLLLLLQPELDGSRRDSWLHVRTLLLGSRVLLRVLSGSFFLFN